jgi:endonuclease YncB( thermonuclease family)
MLGAVLLCTVIVVSDGDTLRARCDDVDGARIVVVRLAEIDAPEHGQAFGRQSRRQLAALCIRQPARIRTTAVDRYGRSVAHVHCRGIDAGAEQVRSGMAWVFDRYATTSALYALEAAARRERRGLWADAAPMPPWQWRERHRDAGPQGGTGDKTLP